MSSAARISDGITRVRVHQHTGKRRSIGGDVTAEQLHREVEAGWVYFWRRREVPESVAAHRLSCEVRGERALCGAGAVAPVRKRCRGTAKASPASRD